ncbi:hypothetical protein ACQ1P2_04025 [Ornithobacterium rhinotracheale]|uniref:hypothetical protein n=1 Tax=Ornithobacterium rhinotracheale TaxID=28251 RepID=UPI001FF24DAB|nr:hypothetical protein [Ornithobacterium rhinotracheale]MCK0206139.1 hypothetical protein [Ornithobacterium rhinotracheale]
MRTNFLDYINKDLQLKEFHYTQKKEGEYIIFEYRKKSKKNIQNISFLQLKNKLKGFFYGVNFIQMEKIIAPILEKNEIVGELYKAENINDSFFVKKSSEYTLTDRGIDISNDSKIKEIFNLFLINDALPFFEKWKDLTVLYEYIKDKTEEELWDILGQFAPMKKAVILRLCNDCNYQDFMNDYYEKQKEYYEEDPEDIDNIRYYNAAKELKEVLDKTAPIYNV